MKLLLSREQISSAVFSLVPLRIGSGTIFTLQAELELTDEEDALLKKYDFAKSALVVSDPIEDLKNSFRPALFLGFVTFVLFSLFGQFSAGLSLGIIVTLIMTVVYFKTLREQIIVRELLDGGRKFRCDSIVDLIKKEAYLQGVCGYLRQILESAKHWDGREAIAIEPLSKEEAKRLVARA